MKAKPMAACSAIVLAASSVLAQPPPPPPPAPPAPPAAETALDAAEAAEDVRILRKALTDYHPGWARYVSAEAMNLAFDDLERDTAGGVTDLELHYRVSRITAMMRCDHTIAEVPPRIVAWRSEHPTHLPFRLDIRDGRAFIARADEGQPVLQQGDEIIAINSIPIGRLIAEVNPLIGIDGFTESARGAVLEYSSEIPSGAIDAFYPALHGYADSFTIDVRRAAASDTWHRRRATVKAVTYPRYTEVATGSASRYASNFEDAVHFEIGDDPTTDDPNDAAGLLRIDTFVNYRTNADPVAVLKPPFEAMNEAMKRGRTDHLILDLRNCGGGSDDVPETLLTFLIDRPFRLHARQPWVRTYDFSELREHLSTWNEDYFNLPPALFTAVPTAIAGPVDYYEVSEQLFPNETVSPRQDRFSGRVTVLCGPANASGATNFMARLNGRADVTFKGEPTGGSSEGPTAGQIFRLTLPNSGIVVRIPVLRQFNNAIEIEPGMGIIPGESW